MLKYGVLAVLAATAIAAALVLLPARSTGPRPEPKLLNDPSAPAPSGFVIKDAPPAAPAQPPLVPSPNAPATAPATQPPAATAPGTPPLSATDLDTLMQKLRTASAQPDSTASTTVTQPAPGAAPPPAPAIAPAAPAAPPTPPPPHWTSVTSQGTRWRMTRTPTGFAVAIDLGNGQVADVRVLPQFGNLDLAATNVRIDYLKQTILRDFSSQSGTYVFARDGSVSLSPQ